MKNKKHIMINKNAGSSGFSLAEMLVAMFIIAVIAAAGLKMITINLISKGAHVNSQQCVANGGVLASSVCQKAIADCTYNKGHSCTSLLFLADNAAYSDAAKSVLKEACIQGSEKACNYFIDQCVADSANCDVSGDTNDLRALLTLNADNTDQGKLYLSKRVKKWFTDQIPNIENEVIAACQENPNSIACTLLSQKVYNFNRHERSGFNEEDSEVGTTFDNGVVTILPLTDNPYGLGMGWGYNNKGQLGDNTTTDRSYPVSLKNSDGSEFSKVMSKITAGYEYTCGIEQSTGYAWCWGKNNKGQLGIGTSDYSSHPDPLAVVNGHVFKSISAGYKHTCGIEKTTEKAWCWGYNNKGQLGIGTSDYSSHPDPEPVVKLDGSSFLATTISAGYEYTCGIDTTGTAWCWGYNDAGQLGIGTSDYSSHPNPEPVVNNHVFTSISVGNAYVCGINTTGAAWCWGDNGAGQLGDGTINDSYSPVEVVNKHVFTSIDAGANHICGIDTSQAGWCWGWNDYGQLGDGTITQSSSPVAVVNGHVFTSISAGAIHTCGIDTAGVAWCWGYNGDGQLGDSTTTKRTSPVEVVGGHIFSAIDAGEYHTTAMAPKTKYYVATTNTNHVTDVNKVVSVLITQTPDPNNTDAAVMWLVSFDNRVNWKKWDGSAWVAATIDLSSYDFSNANTYDEIQTGLQGYQMVSGETTLDFAFDLETKDGSVMPTVDKVVINYY